jgi:hypothetical protein
MRRLIGPALLSSILALPAYAQQVAAADGDHPSPAAVKLDVFTLRNASHFHLWEIHLHVKAADPASPVLIWGFPAIGAPARIAGDANVTVLSAEPSSIVEQGSAAEIEVLGIKPHH